MDLNFVTIDTYVPKYDLSKISNGRGSIFHKDEHESDWRNVPETISVGWLDHPATFMIPILALMALIIWYVDGGENFLSYAFWYEKFLVTPVNISETWIGWFGLLMLGFGAPFLISTAVIGIVLFCIIQPVVNFFLNVFYRKFYYNPVVWPNKQYINEQAEMLMIRQNMQAAVEREKNWQAHLVRYKSDGEYATAFDKEQAKLEQQQQQESMVNAISDVLGDAVRQVGMQQAQALNDFFGTGGLAPTERMMARSPLLRELQYAKLARIVDKLDRL